MASSRPISATTASQPSDARSTLACTLAPEEVRPGDFVAILDELYEVPSFWWTADGALHPRHEPVRMRLLPSQECRPLKVKSVCLPFVLAKQPKGADRTLDVRRCRLARLDRRFAAAAWKAFKKKPQPAAPD